MSRDVTETLQTLDYLQELFGHTPTLGEVAARLIESEEELNRCLVALREAGWLLPTERATAEWLKRYTEIMVPIEEDPSELELNY